MSKYRIFGNTYPIRNELLKWGCFFEGKDKYWETQVIEPGGLEYQTIERLCKRAKAEIIAVQMTASDKEIESFFKNFAEKIDV